MSVVVSVNGSPRDLPTGATVATAVDLLTDAPEGRGVAVALSGEVIPRGAWNTTELRDGAAVEIVVAVQGG